MCARARIRAALPVTVRAHSNGYRVCRWQLVRWASDAVVITLINAVLYAPRKGRVTAAPKQRHILLLYCYRPRFDNAPCHDNDYASALIARWRSECWPKTKCDIVARRRRTRIIIATSTRARLFQLDAIDLRRFNAVRAPSSWKIEFQVVSKNNAVKTFRRPRDRITDNDWISIFFTAVGFARRIRRWQNQRFAERFYENRDDGPRRF